MEVFLLKCDYHFFFIVGKDDLTDKIDFIICLGGDGTLLHASSLFQVRFEPRHEIYKNIVQ